LQIIATADSAIAFTDCDFRWMTLRPYLPILPSAERDKSMVPLRHQ
jgi:hypothetical protein